ncbi:hypothetical protein AB0F81_37935 [Actinoplanes sp. NPDC024001]|uniref:hypothetical protein n=1 Tax=Actinoplanes sp. NPDC024001 TaxID=3154598 RepID=UPI0033E12183
MLAPRIAPLAVVAAFGLAFTSACDGEKTVADAAAATATGPDPSGRSLTLPERQWVELVPARRSALA